MKKLLYILLVFSSFNLIGQNGFILHNGGFVKTDSTYTPSAPTTPEEPESPDMPDGETSLDLNVTMAYNFEAIEPGLVQDTTSSFMEYLDIAANSPNSGIESSNSDTTCRVIEYGDNNVWRSTQRDGSWGVRGQYTGGPLGDEGGGQDIYLESGINVDSTELYFSYNVRVKPQYDFARGGKFPGLKTKNHTSTSRPCDGFSIGLTFRGDSTEIDPLYSSGLAYYFNCYNYNYTPTEELGTVPSVPCDDSNPIFSRIYSNRDSLGSSNYHKINEAWTGDWFNVTIRVVENTGPSNPDGFTEFYYNGLLAGRISGMLLDRNIETPATAIDLVKFYWFYGGGCQESDTECTCWDPTCTYAPDGDSWAEFDDLWCFTYGPSYSGSIVRGNNTAPNGTRLDLPNGYWDAVNQIWVAGQR